MVDNIDKNIIVDVDTTCQSIKRLYARKYEKIARQTLSHINSKTVHKCYAADSATESDTWYLQTKLFIYPKMQEMLQKIYPNRIYNVAIDIGCGTTSFFEFNKMINERILVDISKTYCEYMRKKNLGRILRHDIENLGTVAAGYCDLVICSDILEHVLSVGRAMAEINRITKKGSVILINVPWKQNLEEFKKTNISLLKLSCFSHLRKFDENNISLITNGYKVLGQETVPNGEYKNWIETINIIMEKP